jgi:hypothetical protein
MLAGFPLGRVPDDSIACRPAVYTRATSRIEYRLLDCRRMLAGYI